MKKLINSDNLIRKVTETVECISTNRGPYICPHCNKSFSEFRVFNTHLKDQCCTSQKMFITYPPASDSNGSKVLHLTVDQYFYGTCLGKTYKEKKIGSKFTCYSCQKVLRNNIRFMSHIRHKIENGWEENENINDFNICSHCYRHFDSPFHLQCHLETVHTTVPAASTCRICELNFKNEEKLLQHMQKEHECNEMPYMCKLCSYRSSFYSDLMAHFRQVHENGRSMMCPFCLFVLQTPNSYLKHVLQHRKKNIRCSKCRLQFIQATDKSKHLKNDHSSVLSPHTKTCLPKKPNQYKINVKVSHHPLSPTKSKEVAPSFLQSHVETSMLNSMVIEQGKLPPRPPAKTAKLGLLQPNIKECSIYIRLERGCENSKCLECGLKLGFYAQTYNKHYSKEYSCKLCKFVSHCPTAVNKHISRFHVKRKSSSRGTTTSKDQHSSVKKLCARKHTNNNFKKRRSETPSPPLTETKLSPDRKRSPDTTQATSEMPPIKRRSKLNLDAMLEKAAQQVALENMTYLNHSTAKQPRKQLIPKKVNVDLDTPEENSGTGDVSTITNCEPNNPTKPKKKKSSTAGSSAVQMPSPMLKVGHSLQTPPAGKSPQKPENENNNIPSLDDTSESCDVQKNSVDSSLNKQFTNALGLKELGGTFPKKTAPPSMFNPYKFSSKRLKPLRSPPNQQKHNTHVQKKTPRQSQPSFTKLPLSAGPDLVQPPLPDLCFVKNNEGKILLSTKKKEKSLNSEDAPRPPTFIWFTDVTNSSFTVHWIPPMNCTVTHYQLVFRGVGLPTKQVLPPEQTSVRLVGLRSSTNYDVRISTLCKTLESVHVAGMQRTKSLREYKKPVQVCEVINLEEDDDDDCHVVETSIGLTDSTANTLSELHGTSISANEDVPQPDSAEKGKKDDNGNIQSDVVTKTLNHESESIDLTNVCVTDCDEGFNPDQDTASRADIPSDPTYNCVDSKQPLSNNGPIPYNTLENVDPPQGSNVDNRDNNINTEHGDGNDQLHCKISATNMVDPVADVGPPVNSILSTPSKKCEVEPLVDDDNSDTLRSLPATESPGVNDLELDQTLEALDEFLSVLCKDA